MSGQDQQNLMQGSGEDAPNQAAINELKSRLVRSYEEAVQNGVPPCRALGVILDWVAGEFSRIGPDLE